MSGSKCITENERGERGREKANGEIIRKYHHRQNNCVKR